MEPSSKQILSVDRKHMRRDEANQIIEESRKYLQERRSKRKDAGRERGSGAEDSWGGREGDEVEEVIVEDESTPS